MNWRSNEAHTTKTTYLTCLVLAQLHLHLQSRTCVLSRANHSHPTVPISSRFLLQLNNLTLMNLTDMWSNFISISLQFFFPSFIHAQPHVHSLISPMAAAALLSLIYLFFFYYYWLIPLFIQKYFIIFIY